MLLKDWHQIYNLTIDRCETTFTIPVGLQSSRFGAPIKRQRGLKSPNRLELMKTVTMEENQARTRT